MPEYKLSADVAKRLPDHQADFTWVTGKPFDHFFCPILVEDKPAELCMGHVINEACPDSFGGRVVQRKDVDGWYGRMFEADFTVRVQVLTMGLEKAMQDPRLRKKIPIRIFAGNEELENYPDDDVEVPGHTSIEFDVGPGVLMSRKVKKSPEELQVLDGERRIEVGKNDIVPVFVTLIKSAYLTLFRELGYAYALSRGGRFLGHDILGKFFLQHRDDENPVVKRAAPDYFRPYVNMMRVIDGFAGTGKDPVGTVEDGLMNACLTPNGKIFALKIFVRTAHKNFSVLAPYYDTPETKAAFDDFLVSDQQELVTRKCVIEAKKITIEENLTVISWPKNPAAFNFD